MTTSQKPIIHGRDHAPGGADPIVALFHRLLLVVFSNRASVIEPVTWGDVPFDFACEITGWTLLADQVGDIVIDIWKDTYSNYPPTVADSITGTAKPAIAADDQAQSTTLTGWTTAIAAGDTLRFHVDSASSITQVTLGLSLGGPAT